MAILRDRHLGTIQGSVGDQVFKLRGNKSYIAQLPHSNGKLPTEKLINIRKKFANVVLFSKAVNSVPAFKAIWDLVTPNEVSPYNGIFKNNYRFITSSDITERALVVPKMGGFDVSTTDVSVDSSSLSVSLDPIGSLSGIDTTIEKYIRLGAVIKCTDRIDLADEPMVLLPLSSDNVILNLINPLTFSVNLLSSQKNIYDAYDTHITYLAFVTIDEENTAVRYSVNITA